MKLLPLVMSKALETTEITPSRKYNKMIMDAEINAETMAIVSKSGGEVRELRCHEISVGNGKDFSDLLKQFPILRKIVFNDVRYGASTEQLDIKSLREVIIHETRSDVSACFFFVNFAFIYYSS